MAQDAVLQLQGEDLQSQPMDHTVRIVIADDKSRTRESLRAVLANFPRLEVVGDAGNGIEAIEQVSQRNPDVVLMDVRMPVMDGFEATRQIKARWPQTRVVVLTIYEAQAQATAAGADAFLLKGTPLKRLLEEVDYVQDSSGLAGTITVCGGNPTD